MKLRVWLDSGANAYSMRKDEMSLEDLGLTLEEWNELSEEERDRVARDFAFEYADWGWELAE